MAKGKMKMDRRDFLTRTAAGTVAVAAGHASGAEAATKSESALPTVAFGPHRITRLITGYNPIGGHSHSTPLLSTIMREHFTVERTVEFLQHCEELGINTFQFDLTEKTVQALRILYDKGSKLQFICLHGTRSRDIPLKEVMEFNPMAIAHHGGVTDARFREGSEGVIKDYVRKVKDLGVLAGVSAHCPDNIRKIEEAGWENDFYMTCFHYVTRQRDEMKSEFGCVTVDEPFLEGDPDRMTEVIRQVKKPCLAFKILAAGRRCNNQDHVGEAFKYAFKNIKKSDAVIVGMFPLIQDEIQLNIRHTIKYG